MCFQLLYTEPPPNYPPTAPTIEGQVQGEVGVSYDYTFISNEPEEEDVS